MKRVMIVGGPGSGKSTLARMLGEKTGLPVIHMDHIHWMSGWIERTKDDKDRLTREVHRQDLWILEGGHSRTYQDRLAHADTFIWLDVPVWLRVWRVLKRSWFYRGRSRPDLPEGCPEQFNWQTIEFLRFIWRTRRSSRATLDAIYKDPPGHVSVVRLKTIDETNAFVETFPSRASASDET